LPIFSPPALTVVTNSKLLTGQALFEQLESALQGGLEAVLLREKDFHSGRFLALASRLRTLTEQYQAKLIIHSHAGIAQAVAADGIHLASHDMLEIPRIRTWLEKKDMCFSVSCHNAEELQFAHQFGADSALLSPVFATQTHPDAPALGIEKFKALAAESPLPVVALGGIDQENRKQLEHYPVAVMRALLMADDAKQAAENLRIHAKFLD